jgi:uncharacterized protein (DUF2267 family)
MKRQSIKIVRKNNAWIVSVEGEELLACADKKTARQITNVAANAIRRRLGLV